MFLKCTKQQHRNNANVSGIRDIINFYFLHFLSFIVSLYLILVLIYLLAYLLTYLLHGAGYSLKN